MFFDHSPELFLSFGHVLVHPMRVLHFSLVLIHNLLLVAPPLRQVMVQASVLVFLLSYIPPNFYALLPVLPVIMYLLLVHGPVLVSSRSALAKVYLHSWIFYSMSSDFFQPSSWNLSMKVFCMLPNIYFAFSLASCFSFNTFCTFSSFSLRLFSTICFSLCFSFSIMSRRSLFYFSRISTGIMGHLSL